MSKSREQLESYVKNINIDGLSVIDIGGSQLPAIDRCQGVPKEYYIMDLKQPHEVISTPDIELDIQDNVYNISKKFNVALCFEVAEYWYNPLQALKNINYLLKEKGVLYISFHFLYPVHNPHGLDYLRYTEFGAIRLLNEAGFIISKIELKKLTDGSFEVYKTLNNIDGNKPDKNYNHAITGCLIKAIKI